MHFPGSFAEVLLVGRVIFKDVQAEKIKASVSILRILGRVNLHLPVCSWGMQWQDEIFLCQCGIQVFSLPHLHAKARLGFATQLRATHPPSP